MSYNLVNPTTGALTRVAGGTVTAVDVVENGNMNPVTSNAVYNALQDKQNTLTTSQLNAVNSGITTGLVSKLNNLNIGFDLFFEIESNVNTEGLVQALINELGGSYYPWGIVNSITINLNNHTFTSSNGVQVTAQILKLTSVGDTYNSDYPEGTWAAMIGTLTAIDQLGNVTRYTAEFNWGEAIDMEEPNRASIILSKLITEDDLNNKTYTEVYCSNGVASNLVKNTNLTNPRLSNIESIDGSQMVNEADARIVYKEILKTLWQARNGKPFNFGSANIDSDFGGSVVFHLNGIVGFPNTGTFSDDEDNPTSGALVSQSIAIGFSNTSVNLRIIETKEGRSDNIYIEAGYNSVTDVVSLSAYNTTVYPCIGLLVEN